MTSLIIGRPTDPVSVASVVTSPSGMVRRLGASDAELLVAWCSEHKNHAPSVHEATSFLAADGHCFLMAFDAEAPVGVACGYVLDRIDGRRMGIIYELEVVDRHRRRGYGRQLLEAALDALQGGGVLSVWLTTGRENEPARQLYRNAAAQEIDDLLYQWTFPQ
jgi:ribosomal protein S18 acetylase RimI-like enzyme